jgi:hypothetical protein
MALEPGPAARGSGFELRVNNAMGEVVHRADVRPGPQLIEFSVPCPKGGSTQIAMRIDGGDPRILDTLNFRVFWCGWSLEQNLGWEMPAEIRPDELDVPLLLHTNGCGDFTLMAREHWLTLRGYPEFDLFSMNLDSVFCYSAHHAGFREAVLDDPLRIYHIEHGSGWTPEGQTQLFTRLAAKGIPYVDNRQVMAWAAGMRQLNAPMIFNLDDWGLAAEQLPERSIDSQSVARASG